MDRRILQVVVTALLFAPILCAAECKRLIVTGHPDYPPLIWSEGAKLDGVSVRLVQKLGNELGAQVQVVNPGTWEKAVDAVRTGQADVIAGIYFNDKRTQFLDFVRPAYVQDTVSVIVARSKPFRFSGRADLIGRRGLANKGESFGNDFDGYMAEKLKLDRTDGLDQAFDMLLAGEADYVVNGTYPALKIAIERGIKDKVSVLEPPLVTEGAFIAFSKKSPCSQWAPVFGQRIQAMQQAGQMDALLRETAAAWEAGRR
jgi:polar amino acid transport system substrate-binding protein